MTGAIVFWGLVCLACCVRVYREPTRQTVFHDYGHAGRAWIDGTDAYNLDHGDERIVPSMSGFRYAPVVSVMLAPFALFSAEYGGVLWRLASIACFIGFFAWYLRDALPIGRPLADNEKALLWLLLMPLSLASINNGQANVLLVGLLLGAATAVVKERWNLAAALLAGACLLKLYPLAIALLLILIHPRQLGWRFGVAVLIGLAMPFAFQSPTYVIHQYENWLMLVGSDNRRDFPLTLGYRDFYLLTRAIGALLAPKAYLAVQLGAAMLVAGVGLLGRMRDWPAQYLVTTLLSLGCAWMVVFGPSIESCTFIQIAPVLAWALVESRRRTCPRWSRYALLGVFALFLASYITAWFRDIRDLCYLAQPLAALIFFVERLLRSVTDQPGDSSSDEAVVLASN
jgi:hypothetical protein